MTDTLQIIVAVISVGVTILLALVAGAWNLRGRLEQAESRIEIRLERIEGRIEDLGVGIRSLNQQVTSTVTLLSAAFMFLHRSQAITDAEFHESAGRFISLVSQGNESLVEYLARNVNPLTPEEARRFRELVYKARRGEFFSHEEVEEYDVLIRKVQAERPDDPNIWPLVALGAFLLGLYLGSRRPDDTQ